MNSTDFTNEKKKKPGDLRHRKNYESKKKLPVKTF